MKRALFILLGLSVAMTIAGLLVGFARPIKWPANIGSPEWRSALGDRIETIVEEAAA